MRWLESSPPIPFGMTRFLSLVSFIGALGFSALLAQSGPQGLLVYRAPATSFTEAIEFRSFHQDNALYSTVVTSAGERKQLKAGGVVAAVPYPPESFDADFAGTAQTTLTKIGALEQANPSVRTQLEQVRGRWSRALSVYQQMTEKAATKGAPGESKILAVKEGTFQGVRMTSATADSVTVAHSAGVTRLPLAELTASQVLLLNRSSDTVQLPLGLTSPAKADANSQAESKLTLRIEKVGRSVVDFVATRLDQTPKTVTAWSLFVILPAMVLLLLFGLIFSQRNPVQKFRPK